MNRRVSAPIAGCALRSGETAQTKRTALPCADCEQQLLVFLTYIAYKLYVIVPQMLGHI